VVAVGVDRIPAVVVAEVVAAEAAAAIIEFRSRLRYENRTRIAARAYGLSWRDFPRALRLWSSQWPDRRLAIADDLAAKNCVSLPAGRLC
jgi:hypothetical protein